MFTGIIEELGTVAAIEQIDDSARYTLSCSENLLSDVTHGASIAVGGVCLTVTDWTPTSFSVDVMKESLDRSSLARLSVGSPVNLERAVRVSDRLGGHVVQGHVDGVGTVLAIQPAEKWTVVRVGLPAGLAKYVVDKGSVTLDGTSLTVSRIEDAGAADGGPFLEVSLIPTTLALTTFGTLSVGDPVNIEVDVLAKYVERLLAARSAVEVA